MAPGNGLLVSLSLSDVLDVAVDFCRNLLLLGELALVVGIVFLGVGKSLGLPYLFWHEKRGKQLVAGLYASLLASELVFMSYLGSSLVAEKHTRIEAYLLHAGAALLSVLAAPIALFAFGRMGVRPARRLPFVAGVALGVACTSALVAAGLRVEGAHSKPVCARIQEHLDPRFTAKDGLDRFLHAIIDALKPYSTRRFSADACIESFHNHLFAALIFGALVVLFLSGALRRKRWPSPAEGLCVTLAILAAIVSFTRFWLPAMHPLIPVGAVALLLGLAGFGPYKHRYSALKALYKEGPAVPLASYREAVAAAAAARAGSPSDPRPIDVSTIGWEDAPAWLQGKRPLVLVCASGGGIRAAVWTAAILCELERTLRGFPYCVRLVSGASGGMVGATHWVATLKPPGERMPEATDELHTVKRKADRPDEDDLVKQVAQDSLSAVTHALVFRDLPFGLLPFHNPWDRGRALDEAFAANMPDGFNQTLHDLHAGEKQGWRPSLVYSPMLVEDGRRLLISNLDLDRLLVQQGPNVGDDGKAMYSHAGYELARLFPREWARFPLATAARMSASFPYVSPAAVLPTNPRRRVVDAGYWDNFGVSIACAFLLELLNDTPKSAKDPSLRRWLDENVSGVLLVQIRDQVSALSADGAPERAAPGPALPTRAFAQMKESLARGLEWMTTPLTGLFSSRQGAMMFRNDEQVEAVSAAYGANLGESFFTTVTLSFSKEASLSWYLTEEEARVLRAEAELAVALKAPALQQWWSKKSEKQKAGKARRGGAATSAGQAPARAAGERRRRTNR